MKSIHKTLRMIWICLLAAILMACGATASPMPNLIPTQTQPPTTQPLSDSSIILFRGNPQRTGLYALPAIRHQPEIKWQIKVSNTWLMPPMFADGMVYAGSGDGVLYALNAETGEQVWSADGFGALESTGAIAGDVIITAGFSNLAQAIDRKTGAVRWSFTTGYFVQGSPLIVDNTVYLATDHKVYALDLQTGHVIWQVATGNEGAFMGSPAFDEDVIYTTGGKLLLALDSATGKEIWRIEKEEMFLGLAVANGMIYVGNWDRNLYAFDQATGAERWKFKAGGEFWSAPAVDENTVYAGNIDKYAYAFNAQTGELRWSYKTGGGAVSGPMIADGVVYISDSSHEFPRGARHLYALDSVTGKQLWVFETVSTFLPAPALGDGTIFITSTGDVLALR